MQLAWDEIQANAVAFSKKWQKAKNEEAEAQGFQLDFLRVFGVNEPMAVGSFEYKMKCVTVTRRILFTITSLGQT